MADASIGACEGESMVSSARSRILVLGASGMLGNALYRLLSADEKLEVFGSLRTTAALRALPEALHDRILLGIDAENFDSLTRLFAAVRPHVVVNCIGLVKQLKSAADPMTMVPINSLLPHRLARLCEIAGSRLIHISTDCVFAGRKGLYVEEDDADAPDLYGRSKAIGEVLDGRSLILRTSLIGHEPMTSHSLIEWFLKQTEPVKGFKKAIFSGLPTVELARIIHEHVLPRPDMVGLYHVSASPISKFDLIHLVADIYGKQIEIIPDTSVVIDRSLDSTRFRRDAAYAPPDWPALVAAMHAFR